MLRSMSTHVNSGASLDWSLTADAGWLLRDGTTPVATLTPGDRAWLATTADHAFTIQRVGFHRPRIVVRPLGALAEVAHVQHDWRGVGTLCLASGPCFEIDRGAAAGLTVRDGAGLAVVRLAWNVRGDAPSARVQLASAEATGRFGVLILLVAGYLLVDELGDPSRPRTFGASGPTVRSRFA